MLDKSEENQLVTKNSNEIKYMKHAYLKSLRIVLSVISCWKDFDCSL